MIVKTSPFMFQPATDVQKLYTKDGVAKYGIRQKILYEFNGFQNHKNKPIDFVSALVRLSEPKHIAGNARTDSRLVEALSEGATMIVKRWARIEEVWEDEVFAPKLWKYFDSMKIERKLWHDGYKKVCARTGMKAEEQVKWTASEEL